MSINNNLQTIIEITGLDHQSAVQLLELNDGNLDRAINYHIESTTNGEIAAPTSSVPSAIINLDDYDDCPAIIPPKKEQLLMPDEDNFRPRKQRRTASHNVCPLRNFQREGELQEAKMMEANSLLGTNSPGCSSSSGSSGTYSSSTNIRSNMGVAYNNVKISEDTTNLLKVNENCKQDGGRTDDNAAVCRVGAVAVASTSTINTVTKFRDGVITNQKDGRLLKKTRLGDLFRPPVDLSFAGPLESARKYACTQNQWIIVNLQDNTEFQSQVLNRDLWSDFQLNKLIKKYFVFWQVAIDNSEGRRFQSFYNVNSIPYISIIDPRTGEEKCNYINGYEFTAVDFLKKIITYIQANTLHPHFEDSVHKKSQLEFNEFIKNIEETIDQSLSKNEQVPIIKNLMNTTSTTTTLTSINNVDSISITKNSSNSTTEKCLTEEEQLLLATKNSLIEFCSEDLNESCNTIISNNETTTKTTITPTSTNLNKSENDSYKKYLDDNCDDPKTKLILRLPDSKKDIIEWPKTTKLIALKLYVEQFYNNYVNIESYKIISAYPRQNLLELDINCVNLADAHLHPTAILHLQIEE